MRYDHFSMLPEKAFQPRGMSSFGFGMTLEGGGVSSVFSSVGDAVLGAASSVGNAIGSVAQDVGNVVGSAAQSVGSGLASVDQAVGSAIPGGWGGLAAGAAALGAAAFTGGASLALDPALVASADATATGLGFTSAAEAIQAGAITAEGLGLPAATTFADLAAVSGSASAGFAGLGSAVGGAAGVASQFTPEMLAAANASSDPIGMLSYLSGATPQEIAAATGSGAQAGGLSQLLGYAKTGSQIIGGLGKIAGGVSGMSSSKVNPALADPNSQFRPQYASQLNNLINNPQSVTQTPGYQFNLSQGLQGLQAQETAQGRLVSGGALIQGQQYGQQLASQTYQQQLQNLSSLSGATQAPGTGATAMQNVGQQNTANMFGGINSIAQGLGIASGLSPLDTLYANYNKSSPSQA